MGTTQPPSDLATKYGPLPFPLTLEIVVIPVADVDRAKDFYARLGWRFDIDYRDEFGFRVIQYTPPGSGCSLMFGDKMTTAAPGSVQGLHLVASDVVRAREELIRRGIMVSEVFHDRNGVFHHAGGKIVSRVRTRSGKATAHSCRSTTPMAMNGSSRK